MKSASGVWLAAVTVLAACLGGLGAGLAFGDDQSTAVLVVARTVLQGEVISPGDLATAEVRLDGSPVVRATDRQSVVGTRALVTLTAGSLLAPGSYGTVSLPANTTQVSLRLNPAQIPACPLPGGQQLILIGLPGPDELIEDRLLFSAQVVHPPVSLGDGTVILDVAVGYQDVSRLVPYLIERRVSVVSVR